MVVSTVPKNKQGVGGGEVHLQEGRAPCPAEGACSVDSLQLRPLEDGPHHREPLRGPTLPGVASVWELSEVTCRSLGDLWPGTLALQLLPSQLHFFLC